MASIFDLPNEILLSIFSFLAHPKTLEDLFAAGIACKTFKSISENISLWKDIYSVISDMLGIKFQPVFVKQLVISWYNQNKPLCVGCGIPAKLYYKSYTIVAFLLPSGGKFICPPCKVAIQRKVTIMEMAIAPKSEEVKVSQYLAWLTNKVIKLVPQQKEKKPSPPVKRATKAYRKPDPDDSLLRSFKLIETKILPPVRKFH
jgi:hypothetical protein